MSYRDEFINDNKQIYQEDLALKSARKKAHKLIDNYFKSISESLEKELEIAQDFRFESSGNSWSIRISNSSLAITFGFEQLIVNVREYGHGYEEKLLFEDKAYYSRKHGVPLSEELLDHYLKEAFDNTLKNKLN